MNNLITLAAIAALSTFALSVAKADTDPGRRSVTVQFADLDATNVQGVAALYRRVKSAAKNVCRELEPDLGLNRSPQLYTHCVQEALENALVEIDHPALTAYAADHGAFRSKTAIKIASNDR
jgi:UrcA family protein